MQSFPVGGKQLLFNMFNNGNDIYVIPPIQRQIRRPSLLLPSSFRHFLYSFSQISTFNLTLVTQNFSNKSVVTNVSWNILCKDPEVYIFQISCTQAKDLQRIQKITLPYDISKSPCLHSIFNVCMISMLSLTISFVCESSFLNCSKDAGVLSRLRMALYAVFAIIRICSSTSPQEQVGFLLAGNEETSSQLTEMFKSPTK